MLGSKERSFLAVAETLNFRKAADILGITGSAVTQNINRYEEECGHQMFERYKSSPIKITPMGKKIYKHLIQINEIYKKIEKLL